MQTLRFRGFKLFHQDRDAAESMIREIDRFPSFFTPTGDQPWIVDCGANIGVSVLEWRTRWPQAKILCFEPDPHAFGCLQRTVAVNDIPGIRCVEAAVADFDGTGTLYGDVDPAGDARGNSIDPAWGRRETTAAVEVACHRLSRYLADREISFLKLDVEGAEERVLREISSQLGNVGAIYVEVHETRSSTSKNSRQTNSLRNIETILRDAGFQLEVLRRQVEDALPAHLDVWRRKVGARQSQLIGWR